MIKSFEDLRQDVLIYLNDCCVETGHGKFEVTSERERGGVSLKLLGRPSRRYRADDDEMALADSDLLGRGAAPPRSVADVRDRIMRRLCEIWRNANGNGGLEVVCRQRGNGRVLIVIEHTCLDEIVLRPEEIQISLPVRTAAG